MNVLAGLRIQPTFSLVFVTTTGPEVIELEVDYDHDFVFRPVEFSEEWLTLDETLFRLRSHINYLDPDIRRVYAVIHGVEYDVSSIDAPTLRELAWAAMGGT